MVIREAVESDLTNLLKLYMQLHENIMPQLNERLYDLWATIINDNNHHIIVAEEKKQIISSCVIVIVPNLTHQQRPYALVENVITDMNHRKRRLATACLNYAEEIAKEADCYKIMLLTGSKEDSTLRFYERAGYNRQDKTAFIRWLNPEHKDGWDLPDYSS